jgi:hypothetical protein
MQKWLTVVEGWDLLLTASLHLQNSLYKVDAKVVIFLLDISSVLPKVSPSTPRYVTSPLTLQF